MQDLTLFWPSDKSVIFYTEWVVVLCTIFHGLNIRVAPL